LALWCCGVGAFLLFVATVKWNPWHTRLHTPIIAMLAAPIAVAFWPDRRGAPWRAVPVVIGGCVLVFVAWVAVSNTDRPLFGPNSVVLRPRAESLRWRWPDQQRQVLDAVEGIEDAPSGPVAILANNDDYPVMREILRRDGRRGFTHLYSKLARSATVDPRWQPPAAVVSAYHVRPVVVFNGEFFVRRNEASSLNQYTLVDEPPSRTPGDSIPYFDRYHAFADPSKPDRTGRMAQYHAGHRTVYGLILPVSGLVVTVPGDGEARTLLLALNPLAQDEVGVRISLGEQLLLEAPNLQIAHYTAFELPIPASPEPSKLSITFSSPANDSATDAAAVGWIQLPTNKQLRAYDRRTRLSQTEPKPN
jgi:hypothetical protein